MSPRSPRRMEHQSRSSRIDRNSDGFAGAVEPLLAGISITGGAQMRITTLALIGSLGFASITFAAGAAPLAAAPQMLPSSDIINVAGGCGPRYHPESLRERYRQLQP